MNLAYQDQCTTPPPLQRILVTRRVVGRGFAAALLCVSLAAPGCVVKGGSESGAEEAIMTEGSTQDGSGGVGTGSGSGDGTTRGPNPTSPTGGPTTDSVDTGHGSTDAASTGDSGPTDGTDGTSSGPTGGDSGSSSGSSDTSGSGSSSETSGSSSSDSGSSSASGSSSGGLAADGEPCGDGTQCYSGFCTDGVCCEQDCTGTCETCNGVSPGECTAIASGTDPDDECEASDATTCGLDGMCNGLRGCRMWAYGTECAPSSCAQDPQGRWNYRRRASVCSGTGSCNAGSVGSCFPYACNQNTGACFSGGCLNNSGYLQCDVKCAYSCANNFCQDPQPTGYGCTFDCNCASNDCDVSDDRCN